MMTCKIEKGELVIRIQMTKPMPSSTGKTLLVASTRGATKSEVQVDGKTVSIALNAFIAA